MIPLKLSTIKFYLLSALIPMATAGTASIAEEAYGATSVTTGKLDVRISGDFLNVSADIILDSLNLPSNHQIFITPVVKSGEESETLPSILVNGRNMHFSYERGVLRNFEAIRSHNILTEVKRSNGQPQTVDYSVRVPVLPWMRSKNATLTFIFDSCGCGVSYGSPLSEEVPIFSNPVKEMRTAMVAPPVTELPVEIHEGKARVQFEVNRTELHDQPFRTRNGQIIDNREQLAVIEDSIRYALTDPNVEISEITICGYASPEAPYLNNERLATGRSGALAEYISQRFNLPEGTVKYSAVPENWDEFRRQVETSNEISEQQRYDLLELIDTPAATPEEFDRKEKILNTSPALRQLYRSKILPEWFPKLRATTFAVHTRLKPLSDEELAKVIETTPGKMSLNQMFRVARLYPEGSDDFNRIIGIALSHYPDDPVANLNAAAAAVNNGEYDRAKQLLAKADESPEAFNLLGIIATAEENYDLASRYFDKAGSLRQGRHNAELLK